MPDLTIEQRLARLESSNRRYRSILLAFMLIVACGAAMGFDNPDVQEKVKTRSLEVINSKGQTVVQLNAVEGSDVGRILVNGADGARHVALGALPDGGMLTIANSFTGDDDERDHISLLVFKGTATMTVKQDGDDQFRAP